MDQEILEKLRQQADTLRNNGQGNAAADKYLDLAKRYQDAGNLKSQANAFHMAGVSYKVENNIAKALEYYDQAAKLYQQLGDRFELGRVYTDVGVSYGYENKFDEAIKWLRQSVETLTGQDPSGLGIAQVKLGHNLFKAGQAEEAKIWFDEGLTNIRRADNWFFEMTALGNWAEMDLSQGNISEALTKLQATLGLIYDHNKVDSQKRRLGQIYGGMSLCYLKLENPKQSQAYLQQAFDLVGEMSRKSAEVVYNDFQARQLVATLKSGHPDLFAELKIPANFN